jgi:hypothetical protein
MTHVISGFICRAEHLKEKTKAFKTAKIIPLRQGFAFMPLGNVLYDEVAQVSKRPMMHLAGKLRSRHVPIAWVETDYFGGFGNQSAIVWKNGGRQRFRGADGSGGHINKALKELGVRHNELVSEFHDEFDELGLGEHRTNESWLGEEDNQWDNQNFI